MARPRRRGLLWVGGALAAVLFVSLTWIFPAVYEARYNPETKPGGVADPAWHPIPSAEDDAVYLDTTRTSAPHPGAAVEGRDGYLFLGDDYQANFAQAMGRRYYSRDEVQLTVALVEAQKKWLAEQGIVSEYVVVPAKWSVYSDKMPTWTDGKILPHVFDQLLTAGPDDFVDLREDLTARRKTADTYSRLNSHWTQFGAFVGFQGIMSRLQSDYPALGPLPVPTLSGTTQADADNEFAGITGAPGPNNWTVPQLASPLTPYTVTRQGTQTTVAGDQQLDITQMPLQTDNPAAGNSRRALILADSATTGLSPYLAAAFGSTYMLRHWMDLPAQSPNIPALVESYKPDVVITLVSERNLNVITPDSQMWQAAAAYGGSTTSEGSWAKGQEGSTISVSSTDLTSPTMVTLPNRPSGGLVMQLKVDAAEAGDVTLTGTSSTGPFSVGLRLAPGPNVVYAQIPDGLADKTLTIQRGGGQGSLTAQAVAVRALS